MDWTSHRGRSLAVLGFIIVIWAALALTAPASSSTPSSPQRSAPVPGSAVQECPPSAPNAAAGCVIARTR